MNSARKPAAFREVALRSGRLSIPVEAVDQAAEPDDADGPRRATRAPDSLPLLQ